MENSLNTKLFIIFILMIALTVTIEVLNLKFIRLPQLYLLEADSDQKDIKRIRIAFDSITQELIGINYDNSLWDETYAYVDSGDETFMESNFDQDSYQKIGLNGIGIYDRQGNTVGSYSWDKNTWKNIAFAPFDFPSKIVKKHVLSSDKLVAKNGNKPVVRAGFILLNSKLVHFSATSIFKTNMKGRPNGTMVFWRFADDEFMEKLRSRSGIKFNIEIVNSVNQNSVLLRSNNSYITGSYRTEEGTIFDFYPFSTGLGGMKFIYTAPARQFEANWLNSSTIITSFLFSLTLLVVTLLIHCIIVRPILNAEILVNTIIKANDRSVRFRSERKDELGTLFNLIDRLLDDVTSKEQELKSHNVRLQEISRTDSLTNIANRRAFDKYMDKLLNTSERGLEISMLVCDVDYFKKYNDLNGHALGDKALRLIAESLQRNLHEDTDFVARYGGEEFVVVLKNTNENQAVSVANNLLRSIKNLKIPHQKSDVSDVITLSIGIHTFMVSEKNQYEPMFKKADEALYRAKNEGRNRACVVGD